MNKIVLIFFFLVITNICFAQITKEKICGKKWYPEKYKETDGKIYPLDKETKLLFTKFNCDGTFESWEDKVIFVKGTWTYDDKINSIRMISKDNKVMMDGSVQIVSCDGKKLAFIKTDGAVDKLTIYSIAR